MTQTPEEIAAGVNEAQRCVLLRVPAMMPARAWWIAPAEVSSRVTYGALRRFGNLGLVQTFRVNPSNEYRLTPLGLQVRAALTGDRHD